MRSVNRKSAWTHEQSSLDMLDSIIESKRFVLCPICVHLLRSEYQIKLSDYGLDEADLIFIKELIFGKIILRELLLKFMLIF